MPRKLLWTAMLALAAGLAAAPAEAQETQRRSRNLISQTEIDETPADNVYDLVRARRATWLNRQHRGSIGTNDAALLVFVDGIRLGGTNDLREVATANVARIEFLTAAQSEFRFGQSSSSGAIAITTRGAAVGG